MTDYKEELADYMEQGKEALLKTLNDVAADCGALKHKIRACTTLDEFAELMVSEKLGDTAYQLHYHLLRLETPCYIWCDWASKDTTKKEPI